MFEWSIDSDWNRRDIDAICEKLECPKKESLNRSNPSIQKSNIGSIAGVEKKQ
jgi:hypothetical protein